MAMSAEYRSKFAALHVMVTSPYERKILDWDENHKQTNLFWCWFDNWNFCFCTFSFIICPTFMPIFTMSNVSFQFDSMSIWDRGCLSQGVLPRGHGQHAHKLRGAGGLHRVLRGLYDYSVWNPGNTQPQLGQKYDASSFSSVQMTLWNTTSISFPCLDVIWCSDVDNFDLLLKALLMLLMSVINKM